MEGIGTVDEKHAVEVPVARSARRSADELAGRYRDGFVSLLGADVTSLQGCLEAWSWLLPGDAPRTVIGRNAYGALLVVEGTELQAYGARFTVIDPTMGWCWTHPRAEVPRLGHYLRESWLPFFVDDTVYAAWRAAGAPTLAADEALAIVTPRPCGGAMRLENFRVENVVRMHRRVASLLRASFDDTEIGHQTARAAWGWGLRAKKGLPRGGLGSGPAALLSAQLAIVSSLKDPKDDEQRGMTTELTPLQRARGEHLYFIGTGLLKTDDPAMHARARDALAAATWDGCCDAAFEIARMAMWGGGGPRDPEVAEHYLRIAACTGDSAPKVELCRLHLPLPDKAVDAVAQLEKLASETNYSKQLKPTAGLASYLLGLAAFHGWGGPKDLAKMREHHARAAELGVAEASFELAIAHDKGLGGEADKALARAYERKAAEGGIARACLNMGVWHATGDGLEQDIGAAVQWYARAAQLGSSEAAKRLAVMFGNGAGGAKDEARAMDWTIAANALAKAEEL
jgi:TPR repeat protein